MLVIYNDKKRRIVIIMRKLLVKILCGIMIMAMFLIIASACDKDNTAVSSKYTASVDSDYEKYRPSTPERDPNERC